MADRTCVDCGRDISGFNPAVKRCSDCCADAMRAAGLEPLEPYPGAHSPWRCRCLTCGSEVSPQYANVMSRGRGCDVCGRLAGARTRHLPEAGAVTAMRAAGVEPLEPYSSSGARWACRCLKCGAEVFPRYNDVQQGQSACRYCGSMARVAARRIPEAEAVAIARAAGLEPLEPYRNNQTRWHCLCLTCGRATSPMLTSLKRGSAGCGWCSRHYIHPDEACAVMRAADLEPLVPYPGAMNPWRCQCLRCGKTVSPGLQAVQNGHGCRWCSPGGFNASEDAFVYLAIHEVYDATKVGVTNVSSTRLALHRRRNWQIVMTVKVAGPDALAIEDGILNWWRVDLGLPIYLGPDEMPQGGWTETVASCEIDLAATIRRIRRLSRQAAC